MAISKRIPQRIDSFIVELNTYKGEKNLLHSAAVDLFSIMILQEGNTKVEQVCRESFLPTTK